MTEQDRQIMMLGIRVATLSMVLGSPIDPNKDFIDEIIRVVETAIERLDPMHQSAPWVTAPQQPRQK